MKELCFFVCKFLDKYQVGVGHKHLNSQNHFIRVTMNKFLQLFNGWKTIIGYALLQIPQLSDYPGLVGAIQDAVSNPSRQSVINVALQALLAVGVAHKLIKNIK